MPGFFVSNYLINDMSCEDRQANPCINEALDNTSFTVIRNTLNKFLKDKVFCETEKYILISEGYILNKVQLCQDLGCQDLAELIPCMYEKYGEAFFDNFRGCFSGALYDKKEEKWLFYTNQIGDNPIFYYYQDGIFFVGSEVKYIISACKRMGIKLSFDESAAYQMLTFAFMEQNNTYVKEIKRLRGGMYIVFQQKNMDIKKYHVFTKKEDQNADKQEEELIEMIDAAFRNAVDLEYRKDKEYGYKHIADLSGGLDSRMNIWVAHDLGYNNIQCINYCKSGYLDDVISREIAVYNHDDLFFKQLDDANFLYDVEKIVEMNGGLSFYAGITGGQRFLECMNFNIFGIEHTGQIGDVILGSYIKKSDDNYTGMYSEVLKDRIENDYKNSFNDLELYLIYTRAFQGMTATHMIRRNFTEVASPFMNVDFIQTCLNVPLKYRAGHYIYKKWIITKYPEAANFRWEKIGGKITDGRIKLLYYKIKRKFTRNYNMNPFNYWYNKDCNLGQFMNTYFEEKLAEHKHTMSEQLYMDIQKSYHNGSVLEKTQVLTVLASMGFYFEK